MNSLGTWMMFDAMSDAIVMNSLMSKHGYYHGDPYEAAPAPQIQPTETAQAEVEQEGVSIGWWIFGAIGLVALIGVFC